MLEFSENKVMLIGMQCIRRHMQHTVLIHNTRESVFSDLFRFMKDFLPTICSRSAKLNKFDFALAAQAVRYWSGL